MYKNIFVNGYKRFDVVEDYTNFLKKIEKLKPFLVEFNKDSNIRTKIYPSNYTFEFEDFWLIIIITYDEYIFFANDKIQKVWN